MPWLVRQRVRWQPAESVVKDYQCQKALPHPCEKNHSFPVGRRQGSCYTRFHRHLLTCARMPSLCPQKLVCRLARCPLGRVLGFPGQAPRLPALCPAEGTPAARLDRAAYSDVWEREAPKSLAGPGDRCQAGVAKAAGRAPAAGATRRRMVFAIEKFGALGHKGRASELSVRAISRRPPCARDRRLRLYADLCRNGGVPSDPLLKAHHS
jgi:hypothetical protein